MRVGLRVPPCEPLAAMAQIAADTEAAGFDFVWVPDSQLIWRDVWATLGVMAVATNSIILGTNVTNSVTRDASITAAATATMVEAAPNRFILGIGVGDTSVRLMGRRPSRIAELRDYIEDVRTLLKGGSLTGPGETDYRLVDAPTSEVPVYVSATGPRMLQFGGEVGDGIIYIGGIDSESITYARDNISIGAEWRNSTDEPDLAVGCYCHIGDRDVGRQLMRPYAALFVSRHPDLMREFNVKPPGNDNPTEFYPGLSHAKDWEAAIKHASWVPDPLLDIFCDRYCLIGDGPDVLARIHELRERGVDNLYVRGVHSYRAPYDLLTGFAEHIIPNL